MDSARREPVLVGQTVVVIGGTAGIGLETARRARARRVPTWSSRRAIPTTYSASARSWGRHDLPPQAGLAVFERSPDGLLVAAHVYDDVESPVNRS